MSNSNDFAFDNSGEVICPTDGMEGFPSEEWINASCTIPWETISFEQAMIFKINLSRIIKKVSPIST